MSPQARDTPAWVGQEALFSRIVTADARYTHTAVTTSACQLLVLPRSAFQRFQKLAPSVVKRLRLEEQRLAERIERDLPEEEDALVQSTQLLQSGMARSLSLAADLRFSNVSAHHRQFYQAQKRDDRSRFISGLLAAYGKGDQLE